MKKNNQSEKKKPEAKAILSGISKKVMAITDNNSQEGHTSRKKGFDINTIRVELSAVGVLKASVTFLLVLLAAFILYSIYNILLLFFIAFFISATLDPMIDFFQHYKVPRAVSILFIYFILLIFIAILLVLLVPLVVEQLIGLAQMVNSFILDFSNAPNFQNVPFGKYLEPLYAEFVAAIDLKVLAVELKDSIQLISTQLLNLGENIWSIVIGISNGALNFLLLLILVFFMSADNKSTEKMWISLFPGKYSYYVTNRLRMVKAKIGEWIRGQLLVSLVAAVITFIGLAFVGVDYSLLISLITGVCMIVPVFGRVVASILVLPIVMNQSPALGLFVIIYFFLVSQIENNVIVPLLMNKAVGLSPIIIMFSLMVGFQLMGLTGLVLAIPLATIIAIFAKDLSDRIFPLID